MNEPFLAFSEAVSLVSAEAAVAPGQARRWLTDLARADAVRLEIGGAILRYSELPEVATRRLARRAARQPSTARYNPLTRRQASAERSAREGGHLPAEVLSDQAVHLGDLQKALKRECQIDVDLVGAMVARPSTSGLPKGPVAQLVEFFHENGQRAEFRDAPQETWLQRAAEKGMQFAPGDFAAAWRLACEREFVIPLKGAPRRDQQAKRVARDASSPISDSAEVRKASEA